TVASTRSRATGWRPILLDRQRTDLEGREPEAEDGGRGASRGPARELYRSVAGQCGSANDGSNRLDLGGGVAVDVPVDVPRDLPACHGLEEAHSDRRPQAGRRNDAGGRLQQVAARRQVERCKHPEVAVRRQGNLEVLLGGGEALPRPGSGPPTPPPPPVA